MLHQEVLLYILEEFIFFVIPQDCFPVVHLSPRPLLYHIDSVENTPLGSVENTVTLKVLHSRFFSH